MTMRPDLQPRRPLGSVIATIFTVGIVACSSDGTGLKQPDAGAPGKTDAYAFDTGWGGSVGGMTRGLDAGSGTGLGGHGDSLSIDASAKGGSGVDASANLDSAGGSTGGVPLDAGAGGSAGTGLDANGTSATGGAGGNAGDALRRDGASDAHLDLDAAQKSDAQGEEAPSSRDSKGDTSDGVALDGSPECGSLDQPCCEGRACDSPNLACTSGGSGSGGTCVACGEIGQPCCEGELCSAAGATCTGSGRGGGICR